MFMSIGLSLWVTKVVSKVTKVFVYAKINKKSKPIIKWSPKYVYNETKWNKYDEIVMSVRQTFYH